MLTSYKNARGNHVKLSCNGLGFSLYVFVLGGIKLLFFRMAPIRLCLVFVGKTALINTPIF